MLILGVLLILVGAAIAYFFSPERLAQFGGAVLVIVGVILVVLGALDHADVDTACAPPGARPPVAPQHPVPIRPLTTGTHFRRVLCSSTQRRSSRSAMADVRGGEGRDQGGRLGPRPVAPVHEDRPEQRADEFPRQPGVASWPREGVEEVKAVKSSGVVPEGVSAAPAAS
jgi:hypothetical protein